MNMCSCPKKKTKTKQKQKQKNKQKNYVFLSKKAERFGQILEVTSPYNQLLDGVKLYAVVKEGFYIFKPNIA